MIEVTDIRKGGCYNAFSSPVLLLLTDVPTSFGGLGCCSLKKYALRLVDTAGGIYSNRLT
ncbi:hypothetical protein [Flavipsychrobacter stenotrophus]|uniref:hypothetical protein n=1 Tax=Flavipsychrobacter stenotrophus TaxID=2077091 RepID=UPI0010572A4A|nr:hypothetical protein [Flavipsychrobacter stenotrophus]